MNPDSVTELKQLWLMDRNQAANHIKQTTTHEDSVSDKSGLQWLTAAQIGQLEACQPRTKTAFLKRVVTTAQMGSHEDSVSDKSGLHVAHRCADRPARSLPVLIVQA